MPKDEAVGLDVLGKGKYKNNNYKLMFKTLKIKNFQSHNDSELKFSSGINIIVPEDENNPNDVGKTSIFRALQLLCTNRPSGGNYFPNDKEKGKTEISAEFDGCERITLTKNIKNKETKNSVYRLGGKKFEKFGTAIPDQIVSALNISEINIQEQLDQPYLVTSTPGEIAKTINKITKIEKSDQWISTLTSEINSTNKDIEKLKKEISDKIKELKKYSDIEQTALLVDRLEKVEVKIENYTEDYDNLVDINTEFLELEDWISKNEKYVLGIENLVNEVEILFVDIENLNVEKEKIQYLLHLSEDIEKLKFVKRIEQDLDFLQDILQEEKETQKEKDLLQEFLILIDEIDKLKKINVEQELKSIQKVIEQFEMIEQEEEDLLSSVELEEEVEFLMNEYTEAKKNYISGLKELGKCPTCLSSIDERTIQRIAKEL